MKIKAYILSIVLLLSHLAFAQEPGKIDFSTMTREKVMSMSVEQMSDLPLEDLMKLVEVAGVSSLDELYSLLNKSVTSASKKGESHFEAPLSSTVLTRDEMLASGATCIEEALRLVPGVIVRQKTNGNYDVHIRGNDNLPDNNMLLYSENTKTLVMIDGRPVFNYAFGGILWETLPVAFNDIERIEVVRGPSSALYGPNAVNGAISIITRKAENGAPVLTGQAQTGTMGTSLYDASFRKQVNSKLGVGFSANVEKRDRNSDEVYIFDSGNGVYLDGNPTGAGYYSLAEYERLTVNPAYGDYSIKDPADDMHKLFPDVTSSRERQAVNGYLSYAAGKNINVDLSGGYQSSGAISTTIGDNPTSYGARSSETGYLNMQSNIGKFNLDAAYTFGVQNYAEGDEGFETDLSNISVTGEYDWQWKSLNIRPGVFYQSVWHDDSPYLPAANTGYFNGKKELATLAGSLRLDYVAFDKLRLVAALRAEKYNNPDDIYPSWQFAATMPITSKHLLRAVYSRANQSSFLINAESNYDWDRTGRMPPMSIYFGGNKNADLMTMDMFEFGYRAKPGKSIAIDFEAYYNTSKNFGAFVPASTTAVATGIPAMPVIPYSVNITFQNMALESTQTGASVSVDWVASAKLIVRGHLNYQQTMLDNYLPYSRDQIVMKQTEAAAVDILTPPGAAMATSSYMPTDYQNGVEHQWTPTLYGMLGLTYKPCKHIDIYADGYYTDQQTFVNQYGTVAIDSDVKANLKLTYHATQNVDLYFNGRNLLGNGKQEFAFMDNTQELYLIGLDFKF
jgi:iron complex outermembrane receptor protein